MNISTSISLEELITDKTKFLFEKDLNNQYTSIVTQLTKHGQLNKRIFFTCVL